MNHNTGLLATRTRLARLRAAVARWAAALALAAVLAGCDWSLNPFSLEVTPFELGFQGAPVSFQEITYDRRLKRVLVPAAETGAVAVINPEAMRYQTITGFSTAGATEEEIGGSPSAASVDGFVYAIDRAAKTINVIDLSQEQVVSSVPVEGTPDVIRFVPTTRELWVTSRDLEQIEVFTLSDDRPPVPTSDGVIEVKMGPENLIIEEGRGLAYTNTPTLGTTTVIQVITRGKISTFANGCTEARGMAIDEKRGYLFVACAEGRVVMIDVHTGFQLASASYGDNANQVAYNETLGHVYLPSGRSAIMAVFGIEKAGQSAAAGAAPTTNPGQPRGTPTPASGLQLVRLGTADTTVGSNCIAADERNQVWVCDPRNGRLFVVQDTFPASGISGKEAAE